jgi:hypothetical protein
VLAWLGSEKDNSTEVIYITKAIAAEIGSQEALLGVEVLSRSPTQDLLNGLKMKTADTTLLSLLLLRRRDFLKLFSERAFWQRCWILQELVLAKGVIFFCGQATFGHTCIQRNKIWLEALSLQVKPDGIGWAYWMLSREGFDDSMLEPMRSYAIQIARHNVLPTVRPFEMAWRILNQARYLHATDPRDKIFSLLGIIDVGIEVDYSKAVESIYCELAEEMCASVSLDEWLHTAGVVWVGRLPGLPTWVIDWGSTNTGGWRLSLWGNFYSAGLDMPYLHLFDRPRIRNQVFTVSGTVCDQIQSLAPFCDDCRENAREQFRFDMTGGISGGKVVMSFVQPGIPGGHASLRVCLSDRDPSLQTRFVTSSSFVSPRCT